MAYTDLTMTTRAAQFVLTIGLLLLMSLPGTTGQELSFDRGVQRSDSSGNWNATGRMRLTNHDIIIFEPLMTVQTVTEVCSIDLKSCVKKEQALTASKACFCTKLSDEEYELFVSGGGDRPGKEVNVLANVPARYVFQPLTLSTKIGEVSGADQQGGTQRIKELEETLKNMEAKVKKADDIIGQLGTQIIQLTTQNGELTRSINQLTTTNGEITAKNSDITTKNNDLTAKNDDLTTKISDLTAKNNDLAAKTDQLTTKVREVTAKNSDLTAKNNDLTVKNNDLTTKNSGLTAKTDQLTTKVREVSTKNGELSKRNSELTIAINQLTTQTSQLTTQLSQKGDKTGKQISSVVTMIAALTNTSKAIDEIHNAVVPTSCDNAPILISRPVVTLASGIEVVCDTTTDNGGWILIQRRISGAVDFYRNWAEYKVGFGEKPNNFWLGLETIHELTAGGKYELRVDMKYRGLDYFAKYNIFSVQSEKEKYKLVVSGFSGNAGDSLGYHNGQKFSTLDQDNDGSSSNCAQHHHGAWWYNGCHRANLNGLWGGRTDNNGLLWKSIMGWDDSVTFSEMKIRPSRS